MCKRFWRWLMAIVGTDQYGSGVYGETTIPVYEQAGKVAWIVQVDWDNDGSFGSVIESQSIRSLHFKRGREGRMRGDGNGQNHPNGESFEIEIYDPDARYDVFNSGSELYADLGKPGLLLRILVVDTTTKAQAEPVFIGTLTDVEFDAESKVGRLSGSGLSRYLELGSASALYSPSQSYTSPDSYFVEGSTIYPINYWNGRTDGLTLPACATIVTDLAEFPFGLLTSDVTYSDEPDFLVIDGLTAWEHLVEIADGFAARLFFLRDGRVFFMDSSDQIGLGTASVPGSALRRIGRIRSKPFESLFTSIKINIRSFATKFWNSADLYGTYGTEIQKCWSNNGPIMVPANTTVSIEVEHEHGIEKVTLATHTFSEWSVNPVKICTNPDGTGTDLTNLTGNSSAYVAAVTEVVDGKAYMKGRRQQFTWLNLVNSWSAPAYFFNLNVWGFGLWETNTKISYELEDDDAVTINGKRLLALNNRIIQTQDLAASIGEKYLTACSSRKMASVSWLGYHASGNGIVDFLTGYDIGTLVDFGEEGGSTANANYGVNGLNLIVGQEIDWDNTDGQNITAKLCFERMYKPVEINGAVGTGSVEDNTTLTWSHTVADGDNQILLVSVHSRSWGAISGVTYGGVAMTKLTDCILGYPTNGDYPAVSVWYLVNPTEGTANVVATGSLSDWMEGGAVTLKNVDTSDPFSSTETLEAEGTELAYSTATIKSDLLIGMASFQEYTAPTCVDGEEIYSITSDGNWRGVMATDRSELTGSVGWNGITYSHGYAFVGVVIKAKNGL